MSQRAGHDAIQLQVQGDLVIQVAQATAQELSRQTQAVFAESGQRLASERIDEFDDRIISMLADMDALERFADPAFQLSLKKAQLAAAASGEVEDCELLVRLIESRAHRETKRSRAAIDMAVQIADRIDDEALDSLVLFFS